jgi:hypothetical protein
MSEFHPDQVPDQGDQPPAFPDPDTDAPLDDPDEVAPVNKPAPPIAKTERAEYDVRPSDTHGTRPRDSTTDASRTDTQDDTGEKKGDSEKDSDEKNENGDSDRRGDKKEDGDNKKGPDAAAERGDKPRVVKDQVDEKVDLDKIRKAAFRPIQRPDTTTFTFTLGEDGEQYASQRPESKTITIPTAVGDLIINPDKLVVNPPRTIFNRLVEIGEQMKAAEDRAAAADQERLDKQKEKDDNKAQKKAEEAKKRANDEKNSDESGGGDEPKDVEDGEDGKPDQPPSDDSGVEAQQTDADTEPAATESAPKVLDGEPEALDGQAPEGVEGDEGIAADGAGVGVIEFVKGIGEAGAEETEEVSSGAPVSTIVETEIGGGHVGLKTAGERDTEAEIPVLTRLSTYAAEAREALDRARAHDTNPTSVEVRGLETAAARASRLFWEARMQPFHEAYAKKVSPERRIVLDETRKFVMVGLREGPHSPKVQQAFNNFTKIETAYKMRATQAADIVRPPTVVGMGRRQGERLEGEKRLLTRPPDLHPDTYIHVVTSQLLQWFEGDDPLYLRAHNAVRLGMAHLMRADALTSIEAVRDAAWGTVHANAYELHALQVIKEALNTMGEDLGESL